MNMEIRDKGRYMDGRIPRNVMISVYPSGQEWKCVGFGMVREPGIATWKYFSYPLSALSGVKTQRNHAIWLCLDFLVEGRVETACLPGLSNVSQVEQRLREQMAERDRAVSEGEPPACREKELPFSVKDAALQYENSDPADFVSGVLREAVELYRYPAYTLYRDGESVAVLYRDSGGSLCFAGADGSYQKEDRRVIEQRHIHYYGPAGRVKGGREAAASMKVDLSWIPHPQAYFLYWEEMGRRAAAGENLPGVLLCYFDLREGRRGDLLLPEGTLGYLREHVPDKDWEKQAVQREDAKKAAAVAEKNASQEEHIEAADSGGAVSHKDTGANGTSGKSAGAEAPSGKVPKAKLSAAVNCLSGEGKNREFPATKASFSTAARTQAPVYGKPSYAGAAKPAEQGFSRQSGALSGAVAGGAAGEEKELPPENRVGEQAVEAGRGEAASGREIQDGGEVLTRMGEANSLPYGLQDPNPGGKLTVSQYWDLAKELKKLWDGGIIDEPEYRRIKRGLLDRT